MFAIPSPVQPAHFQVLDEATSALDTETEREIQRALSDLAKGRTSLSIAHRLSTIINSDQIVVMKDGQVIENGGYKALLEQDGAFASMWKKQIFTEAEMVAQAGEGEEGDLIDLRTEESEGLPPKSEIKGGEAGIEVVATKEQIVQEANELKEGDEPSQNYQVAGEAGSDQKKTQTTMPVKEVPVDEPTQDDGTDDKEEVKGFEVAHSNTNPPASYAQAVKPPSDDEASSITEEPSALEEASSSAEVAKAPEVEQQVAPPSIAGPEQYDASPRANRASVPFPSSSQPRPVSWAPGSNTTTPEKRLSFPRMTSSQSHASGISDLGSGSTTPSRSNSRSELPEGEETKMGDKARKRLNSIKGFVRRISDQGLSRSPSLGGKGAKSPMGEMDEATAMLGGASIERLVSEPTGGIASASGPGPAEAGLAPGAGTSQGDQGAKSGKGKDKKKKKKGKK